MKYFTSDIHFCDLESMKEDNRPFKNIKSFDKFILKDWNKTAKEDDVIYVVGDLLDCNSPSNKDEFEQIKNIWLKGLSYIKKVKAQVVLIIGNNEQRIIKHYFNNNYDDFVKICKESGIKEVYKNLDVEFAGKKFHLVHQIKDGKRNRINLFGHTHLCSGLYHPYGLCVSCDLNHFRLFSEEILLGYLQRKYNYWEPDENTNYINPFLKVVDGKVVNIKAKNKHYQEYLAKNR